MHDAEKSKGQPIGELEVLRQRVIELEADQTTLQQTADLLRESDKQFRDLIAGSIQGIIIHRDNRPLFVNQAFADILGYENPDTILPLTSQDFIAPHDWPWMRQMHDDRLAGKNVPTHYECQGSARMDPWSLWKFGCG